MNKVMKNVFLGISAIVSIAIVSIIVGHPPRGVGQVILYAFPGGILMVFIFDPLMKAFSNRKNKKDNCKSDSTCETHQGSERQPTQHNNPFSEKILYFLDVNPLSIGTLDEFKKGREDFAEWGDGVLTGSKEWVVNKLCNKLSEIGASNPPSIRRSKNYGWQTSNLEGFTARIEASIPKMLAGYYIGRLGDNMYGLFGCNFNDNETQTLDSPTVKSINLTEQGDAARGVSVLLVALRWDSNPISKQELQDRAGRAVQVVDSQFDKDVMDVKILVIDESQQYVQLSVRADFRKKTEEEQMREALKKEFIK